MLEFLGKVPGKEDVKSKGLVVIIAQGFSVIIEHVALHTCE